MSQIIQEYFKETIRQYQSGQATEHSYRPALIDLLKKLNPSLLVLNETQKVSVGRPDLLIKKGEITIACLEAKDVIISLDDKTNQEQLHRYLGAFDNFCYTNSLEFRFYKNKQLVDTVIVAKIEHGKIITIESAYERLENQLKEFLSYAGHNITSSKRLAEIMAGKARLLNDVILKVLQEENESSLHDQYKAFKEVLIHDITLESFSDMYSQTLVYGLFVARLHDPSLEDFSRQEAERLIPKSNPFLRELFHYIAFDLEEKVTWIVDSLVEIFAHCDIADILKDFGKTTQRNDPVVHFYETFLSHYNSDTRKARGVYYTPEPVVSFIVKGIDYLLKKEFNIADGIADREKIEVKKTVQGKILPKQEHRVQVLDVATGTGTFLNEIIKFIYNNNPQFASGGMRPMYVQEHLLPRLFGFELLMASYTMCHLKLGLTLKETGYVDEGHKRLGIYLTNSLEEAEGNTQSLFASYLSREAQQASDIKNQSPIMVITGNPPYSVSSTNKSPWIQKLIEDYKKDLNEKKLNLDDDYIKFIRYAQHFIDKNGEGVVGMITNNSYIDGVTHRQMRKCLLESFDKIYVYDLHGNAKKKETAPDGGKDENVFDIMQGVSIIFAVKSSKSKKQAEVYHYDSRGKREVKYEELWNSSIDSIKRTKLTPVEPYYFFVPKDFGAIKQYGKGIKVDELFIEYNSGIQTKNDSLSMRYNDDEIKQIVDDFKSLDVDFLKQKYSLKDTSGWNVKSAKEDLVTNKILYTKFTYRPFDDRYSIYTGKSSGFVGRPRNTMTENFVGKDNLGFVTTKQLSTYDYQHVLISKSMIESGAISLQTKEWGYFFPLYLYNSDDDLGDELFAGDMCRPNFRDEAIAKIEKSLGLQIAIGEPGGGEPEDFFTPEDLFDYIYAVLHSPSYREKYKEFLKIDFPRIPFNVSKNIFWKLVKKGGELRKFHLMEHPESNKLITKYPIAGDNIVKKIKFVDAKVYINDTQYFDDVPESALNFYIGGYQPAQKRLKDRAERTLSFDDILHWQKIIVALANTERVMKEIEEVTFL